MMIRRGTVAEGVFKKYDTDGSGSISSEEFQMMCYELDHCVTDDEVEIAVKVINSSGSGEIKKGEFLKWWKLGQDRWKEVKLDEEELKVRQSAATTFHKFDSDSSGSIEAKEFDAFYANLVESKLTTDSKNDVLESLDKDKDGSIQFPEYVQWLNSIGTITNWVRVLPPLANGGKAEKEPTNNTSQELQQNYWAQYCSFPHASKAVIASVDGKQPWGIKGDWNADANELKLSLLSSPLPSPLQKQHTSDNFHRRLETYCLSLYLLLLFSFLKFESQRTRCCYHEANNILTKHNIYIQGME